MQKKEENIEVYDDNKIVNNKEGERKKDRFTDIFETPYKL